MSGEEGPSARSAREFAQGLAHLLHPVPVRLVDERLTTVTAQGQLLSGASFGKKGAKGGRARRSVIDQAAASVLLTRALDQERSPRRPVPYRGCTSPGLPVARRAVRGGARSGL